VIVEAMFLADAVQSPPGGKLYVLGGGISGLNTERLPLLLPQIAVVGRFRFEEADQDAWPETLSVEVLKPNGGTLVGPLREPFPSMDALVAAGPPPYAVHFCPIFGGMMFPEAGEYRVVVHIDEAVVGDLPLVVRSPPVAFP
jgi:hypothetical protein